MNWIIVAVLVIVLVVLFVAKGKSNKKA